MPRVALVGYGAIGRSIAAQLLQKGAGAAQLVAIQVRDHQLPDARQHLPRDVLVTSSAAELLLTRPDIVIEAAGHAAVAECGPGVLSHGCEFWVLSTGALAMDELRERLMASARSGGGRIGVPAGAMAGFDGLLSLREMGLTAVTYRSTKPPAAWRGTEAETTCDLDALLEARTIFSGSAREAALRYPKNANLAVAIALAGVGLDATQIELIADPHSTENVGQVFAQGANSVLEVMLSNSPFDHNPKTSEITGFSVLAALANRTGIIRFD